MYSFSIINQIFRSIDSNSVKGFPKDPKEATMKVRRIGDCGGGGGGGGNGLFCMHQNIYFLYPNLCDALSFLICPKRTNIVL